MQITLPYGSAALSCTVQDSSAVLTIKEPEKLISLERFRAIIHKKLTDTPLDLSDTCIVIADKTRVCGYPEYLPLLLAILREHGLKEANLKFIIAYGTHPRQSDEECLQGYGDIYSHYEFLHHDCTERAAFIDCGTTARGVPIRLRKDIVEASCVITMGPICHHYFAGYGGGRKLIFPGCGEKEAIYANHSLYLDKKKNILAKRCQPGLLADNPLAEDLFEIATKKQADLAIHGIMDSHGNLCDIIAGSNKESYLTACKIHGDLCESTSGAFPLVVASCGGYPKDINFIQSHKAIHNASMFVQDGGTLIMFAECRDGIGSKTFLPWFQMGGFSSAFQHLCKDYQGNGGTALAMMSKTRRIHIKLITQLSDDICSMIGVERWEKKQAIHYLSGHRSPLCCIPNASLMVRKAE